MALVEPNLDRIQKDNPQLGEALKKVQDYINQNVTQAAGNRVQPPPALTGAVAPIVQGTTTSAAPAQPPPPPTVTDDPSGAGGGPGRKTTQL